MNVILSVALNKIAATAFLAVIFVALVVAVIVMVQGIKSKRKLNTAFLPDLDEMPLDSSLPDLEEEGESFFRLDDDNDAGEGLEEDAAAYKIIQGVRSRRNTNPFKKNK